MEVIGKAILPAATGGRRNVLLATAAPLALAFVGVGLVGAYRYVNNYWLYRGFPAPRDPAFVKQVGTTKRLYVASPALGGRHQPVDVYLPPGYAANPTRRYPVFYLLHGFPGRPGAFLATVRMGVVEDILYAKHLLKQPPILVMPFGSTGTFTDKEWANGVGQASSWETFVARDLVQAIDRRYRTIPTGADRALGGLSEGAYGALNIGLHHPAEFRVLESWSGYERAANVKSIFGGSRRLLVRNSPSLQLPRVAAALRRAHVYVWFYSGNGDPASKQNTAFASTLTGAGVRHKYFLVQGGHNWALWRGQAARALLAAGKHFPGG